MKKYFLILTALIFLLPRGYLFAQSETSSELYIALKTNDSLLFNVGFNNCDLSQFENLLRDNFEFYHDKSGITDSKALFISSFRDGICKMTYKPRRELLEGSLQVYPLKKDGIIYGAVETGEHSFFERRKDESEYPTSSAKFTNVWLLENGKWKLSRVLSYDHKISK